MEPLGTYDRPKMRMAGEALLMVEFGSKLNPSVNDRVIAFDHFLQESLLNGLLESAPMNRSVVLRFDPLQVPPAEFRASVQSCLENFDDLPDMHMGDRKCWRMPVCYGGEAGPDLVSIAKSSSRSIEEIIAAHQSSIQRVFMIGFAPGFLYTGMLPDLFDIPRLPEIKPMVPAGSVSVAIGQTVISSTPNPTGWHTIGHTPFLNFDTDRDPPFLISAGDEIEFYAIDQKEFDRLRQTAKKGLLESAPESVKEQAQ